MSTTGDVGLTPAQARARLLRAARVLNRAWFVALAAASGLALLTLPIVVLTLWLPWHGVYLAVFLVVVSVFNVASFWPTRPPRPGVDLTAEETARLRDWMGRGAHDAAFDRVRIAAGPRISLDDRELVVGMPLLAVLGPAEMRGLLAHATWAIDVERHAPVRRALWIARGYVGRGLFGRIDRDGWLGRRLSSQVAYAGAKFWEALDDWLAVCREEALTAGDQRLLALQARDVVSESWDLVADEWLGPALRVKCWHAAPYSGLRDLLRGAAAGGWLDRPLPEGPTALESVHGLAAREAEVAEKLLGELRTDLLRPIFWADHAAVVTVPTWRATVAEVLEAGRRAGGEPVPATVSAVLGLLEDGWGPAIAEITAADHGIDPDKRDGVPWADWSAGFEQRLLAALVAVAALDAGVVTTQWTWPQGVSLLAREGWTFPLHSMVNDVLGLIADGEGLASAYAELRSALVDLGLDLDEPLWLDHGSTPGPERPAGSFTAHQRLGFRQVVVTDRALRIFAVPFWTGLRERLAMRVRGPERLRQRAIAVLQGDLNDETTAVLGSAVLRARFSLLMGGRAWLAVFNDGHRRVVLWGTGDGRGEEGIVAHLLGDRLTTTWLHAPAPLRVVRNALGWAAIGLGGTLMLTALVFVVWHPAGMPGTVALAFAEIAVALFVLASLPDLLLELAIWIRRPRLRGTIGPEVG